MTPALMWRRPGLAGAVVGLVFFWSSLTPSLVPRSWLLQGVIGGVTAFIGYCAGTLVWAPVRWALGGRYPSTRARTYGWRIFAVAGTLITLPLAWIESVRMQGDLRRLTGLPPESDWIIPLVLLVAAVVGAGLLLAARAVRLGTLALIQLLDRFVPRGLAYLGGLALSAVILAAALKGVVYDTVLAVADRTSAAANAGTLPGIARPGSPFVSGSPASAVGWASLGAQGRNFTATAPSRERISAFTGRPALDPIRVYVGMPHKVGHQEFTDEARLAVRELERTGAFGRAVLTVAGTTGSGWLNPRISEPLEFMYGGDTAIAALQYSYLPSWASFLVDRDRAARATAALIREVRAKLETLPPGGRPRLLVAGESLGSYGVESAFAGLDDLLARTDGALLVGPPNVNPIWRTIIAGRDPGSPVWRAVYDRGRAVRFAQFPGDLAAAGRERPRVLYLQNASDPVVWWSPELLFQRPDWLDLPRGPDVSADVRWFPLVSFWQTTVDLMLAYGPPAPHGHEYGTNAVEGWAAIAGPDGWTTGDTARLKAMVESEPKPY
ncbi:alpha/beta-hydrolase family protein [Spirillospora sp. NPDC047279]|uniref:alpha/beta hydrolase n=1 Tax=Spirillospora sp. NPDC047279 TaxID=3155478 RepID=UPI0033F7F871